MHVYSYLNIFLLLLIFQFLIIYIMISETSVLFFSQPPTFIYIMKYILLLIYCYLFSSFYTLVLYFRKEGVYIQLQLTRANVLYQIDSYAMQVHITTQHNTTNYNLFQRKILKRSESFGHIYPDQGRDEAYIPNIFP